MTLKMFDNVSSAGDASEHLVRIRDRGAIVEVYVDAYEVDFCNDESETLVMFAMTEIQVVLAHALRQAARLEAAPQNFPNCGHIRGALHKHFKQSHVWPTPKWLLHHRLPMGVPLPYMA